MRKTKTFVVQAEGRDKGKTFIITEMPAVKAEKWAIRALLALGRAGIEIPDKEETGAGVAAIVAHGIESIVRLPFEEAEPLLDEMISCVQFVPDPKHPGVTRQLTPEDQFGDVEEIATWALLRSEVFEIHTGFSVADIVLSSMSALRSPAASSPTPTSRPQSGPSSRPN